MIQLNFIKIKQSLVRENRLMDIFEKPIKLCEENTTKISSYIIEQISCNDLYLFKIIL